MSIGNVSKIDLITTDSDTTYRTDLSKGFLVNPRATYEGLKSSVENLVSLTSNTYSDTILTKTESLNQIQTFSFIPYTLTNTDLGRTIDLQTDSIIFRLTRGVYSSPTTMLHNIDYNGVIISKGTITRKNFTVTRTSSSGILNPQFIVTDGGAYSRTYIGISYTSAWEGTIDDTNAIFEFKWKPSNDWGTTSTIQIPFRVIIEE